MKGGVKPAYLVVLLQRLMRVLQEMQHYTHIRQGQGLRCILPYAFEASLEFQCSIVSGFDGEIQEHLQEALHVFSRFQY
jgi:hypothetical protein